MWHHDLHRFHPLARESSPLAMGSLGPVALTYHTARTVLHERRFCRPDDLGLARPYPIAVICELLGAPAQEWRLFAAWTDQIAKVFSTNVASAAPDIVRAMDELGAYLDALVTFRRAWPGDDLLSHLIRAHDADGRLTHDELLMLAGTVLTADIDTTRHQLAARPPPPASSKLSRCSAS